MAETAIIPGSDPLQQRITQTRQEFEQSGGGDWITDRRLSLQPGEVPTLRNGGGGYLDILPRFHGLTFVEEIQRQIGSKGSTSFLDIGCGAGIALLDLRKKFTQEQLRIVGIGHRGDTLKYTRNGGTPTAPKLEAEGITFIHANLVDLTDNIGQFGVVTACATLQHIRWPDHDLLRIIWELLKDNGVAFLGPFNPSGIDGVRQSLAEILRTKYGLEFEVYGWDKDTADENASISFAKKPGQDLPDLNRYAIPSRKNI